MIERIVNTVIYDDEGLMCPNCDSFNLHHRTVTVFDRYEDAEMTHVITVKRGIPTTHRVPSRGCGNPSTRRDGLTIDFECENCEAGLTLQIAQHKGSTYLSWRVKSVTPLKLVNM